jgi:hypothetical protein
LRALEIAVAAETSHLESKPCSVSHSQTVTAQA